MEWAPYAVKEQLHISAFYSMFQIKCDKTFVFPGETHNFWECVYVENGSICVSADERVYNMHAGEMIFHKPYELHKFYTAGEKNAELFIFSFAAEGGLSNYFCNKVFYLSEKQRRIIEILLDYMQTQADKLHLYAENGQTDMFLLPFGTIPEYAQIVATHIYMLFFSLFNSSESRPVSNAHDSIIFSEAVNYMNQRICDNPSVCELAKKVGVSQASLKRVFRKYAGLGVHQYFLKLKLKCATEMLKNGSSVTAAAENLGFSSQGYFTKAFQRETGLLPSALNKKS